MKELTICRNAPGVSHLLFAEDTLLFFRATTDQAEEVKEVLVTYGKCTGQQINPAKCSIMFSDKCPSAMQDQVKAILQVERIVFDAKYLRLPTPNGRMKGDRFQHLKDSLKDYSEKTLSSAAKEILIKSVAQALLTYIMSVFKLPLGLCDDLIAIIRSF